MKTVRDFIFLGSKITPDGDCSHEIKRRLLLGREVIINLDSILKSRHYFANKGPSSQGYGFSSSRVWMWELDYKESLVPKNWCFWTVVLGRRLLRVLWTTRRSSQSILKEISPNIHWKDWCWCWEILKAGEGHNRGWVGPWGHKESDATEGLNWMIV